ncbi:MAG TPA: hypothetical protein DCE41_29220 [Cytophagales bacterium]|nr:hypothetical protein [Cytophagales bacterium]HAA18020.1 hypothetical protein [Cytophagales bacterium]HAP63072.1 hypothetical protein [Cytophagales bacterium]
MRNRSFLIIAAIFFTLSSCEPDTEEVALDGKLEFILSDESSVHSGGRAQEDSLATLVASLVDANGDIVLENTPLPLVDFGGAKVTEPIGLPTGSYTITSLWLVDKEGKVIYATPQSGSEQAYLVNNPLPISITISEDEVTQITPEVLPLEGSTPQAFGYAFFSFNIIPTFDFQLATFELREDTGIQLTSANLTVTNQDGIFVSTTLEATTNKIRLPREAGPYSVSITKGGFNRFEEMFTVDSLLSHTEDPIEVVITELKGGGTLTLQPDATTGKDAVLWSFYPKQNMGSHEDVQAQNWFWIDQTTRGSGTRASLIDFDLSSIPTGSKIVSATLFLYYNQSSVDVPITGGHSYFNSSNAYQLNRITGPWQEDAVTWNTKPQVTAINRVLLPSPSSKYDDSTIDITGLIQDSVDDPENSHGLQLSLQGTDHYAAVIFASSDHPQSTLHPKLVVTYHQ